MKLLSIKEQERVFGGSEFLDIVGYGAAAGGFGAAIGASSGGSVAAATAAGLGAAIGGVILGVGAAAYYGATLLGADRLGANIGSAVYEAIETK